MTTRRVWVAIRAATRFALVATGVATACGKPASVLDHATSMTKCDDCHHDRYAGAADPAHAALGYPTDCALCHVTTEWASVSSRPHADPDDWPLEGRHRGLACDDCHVDGTYATLDSACVACHADDYAATANPDHAANRFPTACETCHSPEGWTPALALAHLPDGPFPLTGGHADRACTACHDPDDYAAVPKTCQGCHADDYAATTDPDHAGSGFPTTCDSCHSTVAWKPATATAHLADGAFPLTGGHAGRACTACHDPDDYAAVPKTCQGCHADDYAATTNPDHPALGLPTTCQSCHETTGWTPADFESHHTMFPITSGKHAALTCAQCHPAQKPWKQFSCTDCMEHSKARMDDKHLGEVGGYSYSSSACYDCHPKGVAEGD